MKSLPANSTVPSTPVKHSLPYQSYLCRKAFFVESFQRKWAPKLSLLYQFHLILLYHWGENLKNKFTHLKGRKKNSPARAWQVCRAGVNNHADDFSVNKPREFYRLWNFFGLGGLFSLKTPLQESSAKSPTNIRLSRGTGLLRVASQGLSRPFLKPFASFSWSN